MNLQIFYLKKNFDVQKAERFFKERRVPYQLVDLSRAPLGKRVLQDVCAAVGLENVIDRSSKDFLESTIRFSNDSEHIVEAMIENPRLIRLPIVRNGRKATVGAAEKIWEEWVSST